MGKRQFHSKSSLEVTAKRKISYLWLLVTIRYSFLNSFENLLFWYLIFEYSIILKKQINIFSSKTLGVEILLGNRSGKVSGRNRIEPAKKRSRTYPRSWFKCCKSSLYFNGADCLVYHSWFWSKLSPQQWDVLFENAKLYRRLMGKLSYLILTWPYISFIV